MAREGTAFFSDSGLMFKTKEEAERQDWLDKRQGFIDTFLENLQVRKGDVGSSMYRDAASIAFDRSEELIATLKAYDMI